MNIMLGKAPPPFSVSAVPAHQAGFDAALDLPLKVARILRKSPMDIAAELARALGNLPMISRAEAVHPGFVNVTFANFAMALAMAAKPVMAQATDGTTIIDFGGPNIKPMHVGHLRSLVLGESLRRILSLEGKVVSDIHWGDWGLPSGMILAWMEEHPDPTGECDIGTVYPAAAARAKEDEAFMSRARDCTRLLQEGHAETVAVWDAISAAAKQAIMQTVGVLGAHFDLLLGERDADAHVPRVIEAVRAHGEFEEQGDAIFLPVGQAEDRREVPPLMLKRADGSSLYGATDMATLLERVQTHAPKRVIYVVDERQSLHFLQVFRAARKWKIVPEEGVELVHRGFGTVNGVDGKPLRTRSGGVMPLEELISIAVEKARLRLVEGGRVPPHLLAHAASCIGVAALKVADLSQMALSGYTLDIDKSLRFEGNTGPALLYAAVRLRSLMDKALFQGLRMPDRLDEAVLDEAVAGSADMRALLLLFQAYSDAVQAAASELEPCRITEWAFKMANAVGRFWNTCPVLVEQDINLAQARLLVSGYADSYLSHALDLLGCDIPPAM